MKKLLKWIGIALGGIVALVVVLFAFASIKLSADLAKRYDYAPVRLKAKGSVARGEYLARVRHACVECHGTDLAGGTVVEDPGAGYVYGPNITPAAIGSWSDGEVARVLRHGVGRDGRPLIVMPAAEYANISEQELADILAYVRSVPAVEKPNRTIKAGPLIKIFYALGKAPFLLTVKTVDHAAPFPVKPKEAPTAELGEYLYKSMCMGCHLEDRRGGPMHGAPPDWPPAANLTADALGTWSEADFVKTLKTGVNPSGHELKFPMIAKYTKHYKDVEVRALWAFLSKDDGAPKGADDF